MMTTIDALTQGAIELPLDQRFTLVQRILVSVEPTAEPAIEVAWADEIRERIRSYDAGESIGISGSQGFAEMDRQLSR